MSKYGNQKTQVGKYTFDSQKEAERFVILLEKMKTGEIEKLALQVPFELLPAFTDANGTKHRAIKYVADFVYFHRLEEKWIVEDVKGVKTPVYRLKEKLFNYKFRSEGLYIREV